MRTLFTILLIALASIVNAQCISVCSTCTTPQFYSPTQGVVITGTQLTVNWLNPWGFPGAAECSKGISFIIDGVEYFANDSGYVHPAAVSGAVVGGYTVIPGATICVVLRNYCSFPYTCNPSNYVDSAPLCVTAPVATPAISCKCGNSGKKYVMTKPGLSTACVNKYQCQTMLGYGWSNSCNCQ